MANEITGAEVAMYADGVRIGSMQSFTVDPNFEQQPLKVLGKLEADGIQTTDYNVSFNFRGLRQYNNSLTKLGILQDIENPTSVFGNPGLLIEIVHLQSGVVVSRLKGARLQSSSVSYEHGQVATYDGSGIAVTATEEK